MKKYSGTYPSGLLSPHIFRAYDIRGIYGKDFDEAGAELIAKGYARYLQQIYPGRRLRIVLGRDGRNSGAALEQAFISGVTAAGIDVVKIGPVTSPLLYFSICHGEFDGGVMITASHNPKEYNGFKLQKEEAHAICGAELQRVLNLIESANFSAAGISGNVSAEDFSASYFEKLKSLVSLDLSHRKPKIVIDAGNGIAGKFAPVFFRELGAEVQELHCEVDGNFPNHDADPEREENLLDLKKKVMKEKADLGLAFDGDGDRVGVVDEKGDHYSADLLLLLLARDLLGRIPGASVVYDLKSTQILPEEIAKLGGEALMCKTGHSFVEEKMRESGALLGGEVSGHLFFAEEYYGFDDALLAAAKLLAIIWNSGKALRTHFSGLPETFITPEVKVAIAEERKFAVMDEVVRYFLELFPDAVTIDGIRIDFGEGAWAIIRASNTSAYLTMRFEARSPAKLLDIQRIAFDHLRTHPEIQGIPEV